MIVGHRTWVVVQDVFLPRRSPVAPRFVHQDGEKWCMEPRICGVSGSVWSGEGAAIAWERGEVKGEVWGEGLNLF